MTRKIRYDKKIFVHIFSVGSVRHRYNAMKTSSVLSNGRSRSSRRKSESRWTWNWTNSPEIRQEKSGVKRIVENVRTSSCQ